MALEEIIRINLNILVSRAGGEEDWYYSNIQDIDKDSICISVPTQGPYTLALNRGELVKVSFASEGARFEFETKVAGWRHDNIPMYVLSQPKEYRRIQLREFVRIPVVMEVEYAEVPDAGQQPVFDKCNSLDLSGGGIRLLLKKEYPAGAGLVVKFSIPFKDRHEEIEVTGRVVRTWPDQNTKLYQVAVMFTKISRRQQDLIVRYVLQKMSEQRRLT